MLCAMAIPSASVPDVVAAGAVVVRKGERGREVLLVHRPKYDDWSFPKGKQDPGEHHTTTCVREVLEETGVGIRLGRPLRPQFYEVAGGRMKQVHYWVGHVVADGDVSAYEANREIDEVGWFPLDEARDRLTYLDDLELLAQYDELPGRTTPLLVVRHAKAVNRGSWDGPDPARPLDHDGRSQAQRLVPLLDAYGVSALMSSTSVRCTETFRPYAEEHGVTLVEATALSEEAFDEEHVGEVLDRLLAKKDPTALCSHRPGLPWILERLGVAEEPLAKGELVVCHHRKGRVVATERYLVT
jgi:8-oxo-(d)GTP phosphatase